MYNKYKTIMKHLFAMKKAKRQPTCVSEAMVKKG